MSYDISLICPTCRSCPSLPEDMPSPVGASVGGNEASVSVTRNYTGLLGPLWDLLTEDGRGTWFDLDGLTGAESIPMLEKALESLHGEPDEDYWAATEGNARRAVEEVLAVARAFPKLTWRVDG